MVDDCQTGPGMKSSWSRARRSALAQPFCAFAADVSVEAFRRIDDRAAEAGFTVC